MANIFYFIQHLVFQYKETDSQRAFKAMQKPQASENI